MRLATTAAGGADAVRGARAVRQDFDEAARADAIRVPLARGARTAWASCLGLLLLWFSSACTSFAGRERSESASGVGLPPPPSLATVAAPAPARPLDEIDRLRTFRDHPGARLRIAFLLQESGDWSAAENELQQLVFGVPAPTGDVEALARWLRSRGFRHRGDDERADAEAAAALALASDADLRARLHPSVPLPQPKAAPVAADAHVAVLPRASWNAAAAKLRTMKPMGAVRRITIHHSAVACRGDGSATAMAAIRSIQRYHQNDQGWGDIGYHYLIDPAGRVWTGRAVEWQGAHAGDDGKNQGNIGVCLLGNFVPDDQGPPPPAQIAALDRLVHQLCLRYHVAPDGVMTHRELKKTDCPGPFLQAAVEKIRAGLARESLVASGTHD
ncbi:MAG: peptidoglycan recognition family protein [Planctomycetota bacterium]